MSDRQSTLFFLIRSRKEELRVTNSTPFLNLFMHRTEAEMKTRLHPLRVSECCEDDLVRNKRKGDQSEEEGRDRSRPPIRSPSQVNWSWPAGCALLRLGALREPRSDVSEGPESSSEGLLGRRAAWSRRGRARTPRTHTHKTSPAAAGADLCFSVALGQTQERAPRIMGRWGCPWLNAPQINGSRNAFLGGALPAAVICWDDVSFNSIWTLARGAFWLSAAVPFSTRRRKHHVLILFRRCVAYTDALKAGLVQLQRGVHTLSPRGCFEQNLIVNICHRVLIFT